MRIPKSQGVVGMCTILCMTFLAGCATPAADTLPAVPSHLKPPAGQKLAFKADAVGVQIYVCALNKSDPTRFEWEFKAPEAELFDASGKKIGIHYAGPTWESTDGSKVVGEIKARDDGPDAGAIPWLLLGAKSNAGTGVFAATASIQRIHTVGGKTPVDGCTGTQFSKESRVPYKAAYYFYVAQ
jgi:hypothetical protein